MVQTIQNESNCGYSYSVNTQSAMVRKCIWCTISKPNQRVSLMNDVERDRHIVPYCHHDNFCIGIVSSVMNFADESWNGTTYLLMLSSKPQRLHEKKEILNSGVSFFFFWFDTPLAFFVNLILLHCTCKYSRGLSWCDIINFFCCFSKSVKTKIRQSAVSWSYCCCALINEGFSCVHKSMIRLYVMLDDLMDHNSYFSRWWWVIIVWSAGHHDGGLCTPTGTCCTGYAMYAHVVRTRSWWRCRIKLIDLICCYSLLKWIGETLVQ